MNELTVLEIAITTIIPPAFIVGGIWIIITLLGGLDKLMESKIEIAQKRVVSITVIGNDADRIEEILRTFLASEHKDRRLKGFAQKMLKRINEQRNQIRKIELEEQRQAMEEFFSMLDEDKEIVELTEEVLVENNHKKEAEVT